MNNHDKILNIIKKRTNKKFNETTEISFLGLDSLDLVELIIEIEDELSLKITDEKLKNIKTINDLLVIIEQSN